MDLKLFLDDSNTTIWEEFFQSGIFYGITTNPTLLRQANEPCNIDNIKKLARKAKKIGCKELHLQAWGESSKAMFNCGKELSKCSTPEMEVFVKVPITRMGCTAAKKLISSNIPITLTACFEVNHSIIAAAAGAKYMAPYMGRITDQGKSNGFDEILAMQKALKSLSSNCKILVASIRNTTEIIQLASNGLKNFTINQKVAYELLNSEATIKAAEVFEEDAKIA